MGGQNKVAGLPAHLPSTLVCTKLKTFLVKPDKVRRCFDHNAKEADGQPGGMAVILGLETQPREELLTLCDRHRRNLGDIVPR